VKTKLMTISRSLFLSTLFSCFLINVYAQDTGEYVVTVRNDTLPGEVKFNTYSLSNESVTLKDKNKKKQNFTPNTAKAFKFRGNLYHSVLLRDHYTFMQVIESGYLSMYEHQDLSRQSGAQEINSYLKMNMGELVSIPKIGFRKKIAPLLQDCPSVYQKVEEKTYDFSDLKAIAIEYNQCIANQPKVSPAPVAAVSPEASVAPANSSVQELLTYLEKNPQTTNHDDLLSCLTDIGTKVRSGSSVPKYLLDALVNLSKPTEAISEKALKLATDLGYQAGK
jgi:hypothetical protein